MTYDLVIRGGRVIDPETGRDEIADVAVADGRIAAVGAMGGTGWAEIDAGGLVVAPGFVDIHAHGQSVAADRMQAFDGVTTTLELEVGALPVDAWYDRQAGLGRVLNYGTAAAWMFARKAVLSGLVPDVGLHPIAQMGRAADDPRWQDDAADDAQADAIVAMVREGLDQGAIGIGIPNGYAPGTGAKELAAICDLAAATGVPTFTHIAFVSNHDPRSSVDAYVRLIGLAAATGAHMHVCHLNSTSLLDIERASALLSRAQAAGLPITVEAYPYGTGSTVVGATFFADPDFVHRSGSDYGAIELVKNHHRIQGPDDLAAARAEDPSDLVLWHFLDVAANDRHRALLDMSVLYPGGSIASDAIPWVRPDGTIYEGDAWPLPDDVSSHPRASGTFTRFLRDYVRERGALSLMDGIAKCTIIPCAVIEGCAPQMARKARLRAGCDADVVVFDYDRLTERATFQHMNAPAEGVMHLLVGGAAVIADGTMRPDARPGRPIRRTP